MTFPSGQIKLNFFHFLFDKHKNTGYSLSMETKQTNKGGNKMDNKIKNEVAQNVQVIIAAMQIECEKVGVNFSALANDQKAFDACYEVATNHIAQVAAKMPELLNEILDEI